MYSKGYVVGFEVILPNVRRVDVAGFNENREIIFVEVKASDNDFQNDKKWKEYLLYCDKFYILEIGGSYHIAIKLIVLITPITKILRIVNY